MCVDCAARMKLARDAVMKMKIKEAAGHIVTGALEIVGAKDKTGLSDLNNQKEKAIEKPKTRR